MSCSSSPLLSRCGYDHALKLDATVPLSHLFDELFVDDDDAQCVSDLFRTPESPLHPFAACKAHDNMAYLQNHPYLCEPPSHLIEELSPPSFRDPACLSSSGSDGDTSSFESYPVVEKCVFEDDSDDDDSGDEDDDGDRQTLAESDADDDAQYITIHPGSPWYRPQCLVPERRRGSVDSDTTLVSSPSLRPKSVFATDIARALPGLPSSAFYGELEKLALDRDFEVGWLGPLEAEILADPTEAFKQVCLDDACGHAGNTEPDVPSDLDDMHDLDDFEMVV